ncbi:hypothetical protein QR680_013396 [Steinernema hermaphroditum]|uniref:C-type lectin domain-containing protein n=1 Tax=Steinernema hermaphroditum TaxID=289476 RepID=A0AA39M298_9BILA|nr:hypothetical protein QR680_013396 [Steinernema hermaphroditum]
MALGTALLLAFLALGLAAECPPSQFPNSDSSKCFELVPILATSAEAEAACAHFGGALATVENARDHDILVDQIYYKKLQKGNFWVKKIGKRCAYIDGKFQNIKEAPCDNRFFYVCEDAEAIDPSKLPTPSPSTTSSTPTCPEGWDLHEGNCYFVSTERTSRPKAEALCRSKEADLASIHSVEENDYLGRLFSSRGGRDNFWLGAERSRVGDKWTDFLWSDGSVLNFSNWGKGQPDSWNPCVTWSSYDKKWGSAYCENLNPQVVCKRLLVPRSTVTQTTAPTLSTPPLPSECLPGWQHFSGNCYFLNHREVKWMAAEQFCRARNGHLASIHSSAENRFVQRILQKAGIWHFTWIGGVRNSTTEKFRWTDGSEWDFSNWINSKQLQRVGIVEYLPAASTWSVPILNLGESKSPSVCKRTLRG